MSRHLALSLSALMLSVLIAVALGVLVAGSGSSGGVIAGCSQVV